MKKIIPIVIVLLVGLVIWFSYEEDQRQIRRYEHLQQDIRMEYEQAIKDLDIDDAYKRQEKAQKLYIFAKIAHPEDFMKSEIDDLGRDKVDAVLSEYRSNALVLDDYVSALKVMEDPIYKQLYRTDAELYKAAYDDINKVPPKYAGPLKDRIAEDRKYISYIAGEKEQQLKTIQEEEAKKLHIGDSEEKIQQIYGAPKKINRTVTGGMERNQYVYSNLYIYTENGRVIGWQD